MEPVSADDCRVCQLQQQQRQQQLLLQQQEQQLRQQQQQQQPPSPGGGPGGGGDEEEAGGGEGGAAEGQEKSEPVVFNRNFLRCLVLLLPVSVPVVVYVRDADSTRRFFLFAFALFLLLMFSCVTVALVRSRSAAHASDDEEEAAPRAGRPSSRGLPFLRAMPYRVAARVPPRYPGYRWAGRHQLSAARCAALAAEDPPPCYLDALRCPLAQTHKGGRDTETPPPPYDAISWASPGHGEAALLQWTKPQSGAAAAAARELLFVKPRDYIDAAGECTVWTTEEGSHA